LRRAGYSVITAGTLADARRALSEHQPDFVIFDAHGPGAPAMKEARDVVRTLTHVDADVNGLLRALRDRIGATAGMWARPSVDLLL
jgi:DNA-binding response OmpR family regulator